jgi:hypothetical protein
MLQLLLGTVQHVTGDHGKSAAKKRALESSVRNSRSVARICSRYHID